MCELPEPDPGFRLPSRLVLATIFRDSEQWLEFTERHGKRELVAKNSGVTAGSIRERCYQQQSFLQDDERPRQCRCDDVVI